MNLRHARLLTIAVVALAAIGLAACGGSDNGDSSNSGSAGGTAADTGGGGQTVATKSISGVGNALVDSSGKVLYTNDMDTGSKIACTDQCLTEWVPLAAPSGGQPSADDSAVQAKLGTVKRPDGSTQVTFGGMPLYSFAEDSSGQVTGDGFTDDFGGTHFVWTAARGGGSAGSGATTTSQSSGGKGGIY
jgi:predicted lipoprotein with Yx(FWY)xxD motif